MSSSLLFFVTPAADLAGEAVGEFEAAVRRELEAVQVLQRNVRGQRSSLYRETGAGGRPRYLWLLALDLVGGSVTGGSAVAKAVNEVKEKLKDRVTIDEGFALGELTD